MKQPGVYLLHFDSALAHAQHYLGSAADLDTRIEQHRRGTGSRLTHVIKSLGISFQLARVWNTDTPYNARVLERRLKKQKNGRKHCPTCKCA